MAIVRCLLSFLKSTTLLFYLEKNLSDKPRIHKLQASIVEKCRKMQDLESKFIENMTKQEELLQVSTVFHLFLKKILRSATL